MNKIILCLFLPFVLLGSELVFQFKSPTFTGISYSAHKLTLEQISFNRKKAIEDEIESAQLQAQLAEERSAVNTFLSSLQARIYSELAKQVTEQLFADDGLDTGTFSIEDSTITWYKSADDQIYLTINDLTDGSTTSIIIPIGSLYIPTPVTSDSDSDG